MKIKKYCKIYAVILSNAFSYEAQYRQDTILKLFTNCLWIAIQFLTIEIIFSKTISLNGWDKESVYLMAIFWIMADELFLSIFNSVTHIPELIVSGELDAYLTKPVSSLFICSVHLFLTRAFYRFTTQIIVLLWIFYQFNLFFSIGNSLIAGLLIINAVIIDYARTLIANTLSFWFLRIDNVNDAIGAISSYGKYPLSIWPKTVKILFLTFIPVAFSGFIPAAAFSGNWPWYGTLYAFAFMIVILCVAIKFWNFAIKRYSSASS